MILLSSKEEVLKRVDALPNSLVFNSSMPSDLMTALTFMKRGYKWKLSVKGRLSNLSPATESDTTPIVLNKGQSFKYKLPKTERGYIININSIFNNPNGSLKFRLDDWAFDVSPINLRIARNVPIPTANWYIYLGSWAPMTPYGPMYGVTFDPIQPIPITRDTSIDISNPTVSMSSSVECLLVTVGMIVIEDYVEFLDEWQRVKSEFLTGSEAKNWESRRR